MAVAADVGVGVDVEAGVGVVAGVGEGVGVDGGVGVGVGFGAATATVTALDVAELDVASPGQTILNWYVPASLKDISRMYSPLVIVSNVCL